MDKGDYLLVEDTSANKGLIVQVIGEKYADLPGLLEDVLRELISVGEISVEDYDPFNISSYIMMIKDARVLRCKVRGVFDGGRLVHNTLWLPSRPRSRIKKFREDLLLEINHGIRLPIELGKTKTGSAIEIDACNLDGKLSIITGKKETGKSHLAKLLILGLIDHGGEVVVFDVNGEYCGLGSTKDGKPGPYHEKIIVLTLGENFRVTLRYAGLGVIMHILRFVYGLPETSTREFRRIWSYLRDEEKKYGCHLLTLEKIGEVVRRVSNDQIRDALFRRYCDLVNSGLFTDDPREEVTFEECFKRIEKGGALVINLSELPSEVRRVVVEFMLSKLTHLLEEDFLKGLFLFAEEAHLYLRETYWEDIITRMRHLGIYTTFVTNQPDSINLSVYRQADNIFLFNFTNDSDLTTISKASTIDTETALAIASWLPPHHCLILGKVVSDLPIVVKVNQLPNIRIMGETRLFFPEGARDYRAVT